MKYTLMCIAALALSGCTTTRHIVTPCLKGQAIPAEPERVHDRLTGQADSDIRIIAGSNIKLRSWGQGLRELIEACR